MGGRRVFWSTSHQMDAGKERPNPRDQTETQTNRANPPVIKSRLIELLSTGAHIEEQLQLMENEPAKIAGKEEKSGEHDAGLDVTDFPSRDNSAESRAGQLVDHRAAPRFRAIARRMNEFEHGGSIFQRATVCVSRDCRPRDNQYPFNQTPKRTGPAGDKRNENLNNADRGVAEIEAMDAQPAEKNA